jgi:hypothetical protein
MLDLDFHTVGCVLLIIMPASKLPVVLCLCDQVLILVMHRQVSARNPSVACPALGHTLQMRTSTS